MTMMIETTSKRLETDGKGLQYQTMYMTQTSARQYKNMNRCILKLEYTVSNRS